MYFVSPNRIHVFGVFAMRENEDSVCSASIISYVEMYIAMCRERFITVVISTGVGFLMDRGHSQTVSGF